MVHIFRLPRLRGPAAAFVLFAAAAAADTTPPQLVSLSVSPLSADTSSGPAALTVSIAARDDANGFDTSASGNGRIVFTSDSGTTVFGRQSLPVTGGTATNPVFQFVLTVPQFSPAGAYRISLTLEDTAFNTATFSSADLQARGFPSSILLTLHAFGSIALSPSAASVPAEGASGSVLVTASSGGFSWSAASSAFWLTIASGASGTGSGTIAWVAAPNSSLASRTGTLTAGGQTFTVLQAAAGSNLGATAVSLLFAYQVGGATPPPQPITVFSSGAQLSFSASAASAGNWLFVSPASGVTSTILSVFVNPTALAPGTYNGSVTVTAAGSSNGSQVATVTLVVNGSQALTVAPAALTFAYQQGSSNPASQALAVTAAAPAGFTASASSAGNWLAVTPASSVSPSTLSVSVFPAGLAPGTYGGSVTIGTGAGGQIVAVTLVVAAYQAIAISPASFTFAYAIGGAVPVPQALTLSGGTAGVNFSASAASAGNWLTLGASSVVTPGGLSVAVNPAGLAAGFYSGAITLAAANSTPQTVPVTLIITGAQGFSVSPTSLTFNTPSSGVTPPSQLLFVSGVAGQTVTAAAAISRGNWLQASPFSSLTPASVGVFVSPAGLAPGTYFGSVTLNSANSSQTVPVTLVVGGSTLVAIPASLVFTTQPGGPASLSQTVVLNSSGDSALNFTARSAIGAGNWLIVSPSSGVTPASLTVTVNSAGLAPAIYRGSIALSLSGASDVQALSVSLTVTGTGVLTVSPTSLAINYQVGDPVPGVRTLSVTSSGVSIGFTASASSAGNWLAVSPASGSSPGTLNVQLSPAGLAPGSYTGTIQVQSSGATVQTVTVSLTVNASQNLSLIPSSLLFSYQIGGITPAAQNITVGCANSALSFRPAASSVGNWLLSSVPNGANNNQIIVSVNPAGLAARSYSGNITIFGVGACNTTQTVPVTLVVSTTQALTLGPGALSFAAQAGGGAPAPQSVLLDCAGAVLPYSTVASSNGGWLRVNPAGGNTPANLTISVDPSALGPGSYSGSVAVSVAGACAGNQTISVGLAVSGAQALTSASLTFSAGSLSFTAFAGGAAPPVSQVVSLACNGAPATFTATAVSNGGWLSMSPSGGTTPATLTLSVNPTGLAAGSYSGSVNATSAGCGAAAPLPVTVIVNPVQAFALTPASFAFTYLLGGANPASQTLSITGGAGQAVTVTMGSAGGWLSVNPLSATAPAVLSVAVNPAGLSAGTYSGVIVIASQSVAVTLTVATAAPPANIVSSLSFTYQLGGALPASQSLPIGFAFTAAASSPDNWLSASPSSATSAASVIVSVNPVGLAPGTYSGVIAIILLGAAAGAQSVPVTLEITALVPFIGSLVNAASLLSSPLAPGEIVSIFGRNLGPPDSATLRLTANVVDNLLAGTRVIINGQAAPMLFSQAGQVNTIIPYSAAGRSSIEVQIEYQGVRSSPATFSVAEAAPAIFTDDASGRGQGAVLNQDTSINSSSNPADSGSIAVLYATGAGQMLPVSGDGTITGATLGRPLAAVAVSVDGQDAAILYAGSAPGLVAGALQVNFRLPAQVRPGAAVPLVLKIGRFTSQSGVTLAIR